MITREITALYLVSGKYDVGSLQETRAKQVAEGVVFLVEGEDGRRGKAWVRCQSDWSLYLQDLGQPTGVDLHIDLVLTRSEQDRLVTMVMSASLVDLRRITRKIQPNDNA